MSFTETPLRHAFVHWASVSALSHWLTLANQGDVTIDSFGSAVWLAPTLLILFCSTILKPITLFSKPVYLEADYTDLICFKISRRRLKYKDRLQYQKR